MISAVETKNGTAAITSDRWHVVHARFVGQPAARPFLRSITSEHDDRASCVRAARALIARIRSESGPVPIAERDQAFVRRPGYKSFKNSKRRTHVRPRDGKDGA
ncbi:MAG TPA: hypothetical protein VFL14_08330 [Xanthomonadales bacterium]|nr:hypothetical protein [Xanthomonadales bacterium]